MRKSVEVLQRELASIRTGRASPGLLEHLRVEYAGATLPLNQLGSIAVAGPNLLTIQPWDQGSINAIQKAIMTSDLGLNPSSDGRIIRVTIPPLTEERRQELIRIVRRRVEESRVAIRNLRRDGMDELKSLEKEKEISQDEHKRLQGKLQKLTDTFIAEADQLGRAKEAEVLEI